MMTSKIKLLVIDDDDINIFIIKKIVEKTGFNVEMVAKTNGQMAIDYITMMLSLQEPLPHLVLIDINMPVLNGWEFLDAYGQLNINQKIDMYMLSSSVYENDIEKAKTYQSVKGFISKPLSIERLTELFKIIEQNSIES
ncbi:response regulator [Pedobacter sp. PACM 27299]|uniref:response regulator n=1 Tax=Pedobacter sp. PACM 27299 TaxID=1727164 RepID=UPI000705C405|nr:response regulator [Pedobacter sp. PACM 27299]ALL04580.1 response regulator [Pedobacter sp. PACM 27299]